MKRITEKLDKSDEHHNRDNGESICAVQDGLTCITYFDDIENFKEAYDKLVNGKHKKLVTAIRLAPKEENHKS